MKTINTSSRVLALSLTVGFSSIAGATLIDRGGGLIYDDVFNITWLQDANYANTAGYVTPGGRDVTADPRPGTMTWSEAVVWADQLVYGGFEDWRLPASLNLDGSGPDSGFNVTGSPLGHLFYAPPPDGLGNVGFSVGCTPGIDCGLVNTGLFINLADDFYWSSTEFPPALTAVWGFRFDQGFQGLIDKEPGQTYAWAVRDGDVAAIPEPATGLLLGAGLGALGWLRRSPRRAE